MRDRRCYTKSLFRVHVYTYYRKPQNKRTVWFDYFLTELTLSNISVPNIITVTDLYSIDIKVLLLFFAER